MFCKVGLGARRPTHTELYKALKSTDMLLFFGHVPHLWNSLKLFHFSESIIWDKKKLLAPTGALVVIMV